MPDMSLPYKGGGKKVKKGLAKKGIISINVDGKISHFLSI